MECIVIHKGKEYSFQEFKSLLLTDPFLYETLLKDYKALINAVVNRVKIFPELLNEGNIFQLAEIATKSGMQIISNPEDMTVASVQEYKGTFDYDMPMEFSDVDKYTIMQEVISRVFANLDVTESVNTKDLYSSLLNVYTEIQNQLAVEGKTQEADFMEESRDEILGYNIDEKGNIENYFYEDSIREYIDVELDIDTSNISELDSLSENVKEHGQASYEIDITKALSSKVKLMFSSIKDSTAVPGFGGFKNNLSGKDALDAIQQILSESANNSIENLEEIIKEKIALNPIDLAFYQEILDVLKQMQTTNPEILNQILYNLYQTKVQMKFIMWNAGENGSITVSNYDANVKNPLFIKRDKWTENLKISGLIDQYESIYYKVNENAYNRVNELHDNIMQAFVKDGMQGVDRADLVELLSFYGITLNSKTIDNMYEGNTQNDYDIVTRLIGNNKSALNIIKNNIDTAFNSEDKLSLEPSARKVDSTAKVLNPLTFVNSQINDIIQADNFVEFLPMGTMYIAGKTINMYQQPNPITNKMRNLKRELLAWAELKKDDSLTEEEKQEKLPPLLKRFLNTEISSNSLLINLLMNEPEQGAKYVDTFLISLEALKEKGTKSREDMGVTELSDRDSLVTLLGMFSSSEGNYTDDAFEEKYEGQLNLRKGYMNFFTISDSSQMPLLKTFLVELAEHNIDLENDTFDEHTSNLLREQLVMGDVNRIFDFLSKVKDTSNIAGYDAGATWITTIGSLNSVLVDVELNGKTVKRTLKKALEDLVLNNNKNLTKEDIKNFIESNKDVIDKEIQSNITYEVDRYINKEGNAGLFVDSEMMGMNGHLNIDDGKNKGYFEGKSARLIAYDYVLNNFIQQKEIQTLFAGDMAYYFKDKMAKDLKHSLPKVTFTNIVNYHYGDSAQEISDLMNNKKITDFNEEEKNRFVSAVEQDFPLLKYADELITPGIDHQEQYEALSEVVGQKINKIFKGVQNNLSKRLKGQLSPGSQYSDVANIKDTYQIMLADVETASETIEEMVERAMPEIYQEIKNDLREFKRLDEKAFLDEEEQKKHSNLLKSLEGKIPNLAAYLRTTSTDAQEYTSWQNNLEQLKFQGRISFSQYEIIKKKLEAQSKELTDTGSISDENRLSKEEMSLAMMQPSKPLYSGLVDQNIDGHIIQRYVYIKSSSFPIIPELALMFPKLNNMRKVMEAIEAKKDVGDGKPVTVRMAYESAVKVGGAKNLISVKELQQDRTPEELEQFLAKVDKSSMLLPKENFYIQQDKPYKSDKNLKNNKPDRTIRATQFEKIILGDKINKMGSIFPAQSFDAQLLKELGIEIKDNKIDGPSLKKIYDNVYKREQELLIDKLFNELGIDSYDDVTEGKPEVMEKLSKQLNKRLNNKQDKKAIELLYKVVNENGSSEHVTKQELVARKLTPLKAVFRMPLMMTPNSKKFESVLNSMINKSNINLDLPGFSFPVASQEGFDYRGYSEEQYKELKSKGLIVSPNFDPSVGLKSERDAATGALKHAQVFLASKYKFMNTKTGKYEYIDWSKFVKEDNTIDLDRVPEDLLSMFSFRIPTSRHQSGAVIEVAGFLPHNMGDLMIVPKDHTVQIGEDYDIDVRYAYQYNYMTYEDNGVTKLKKIEYSDIEKPEKSEKEFKKEFKKAKQDLWNKYYKENTNVDQTDVLNPDNFRPELRHPYLEANQEKIMEIVFLQDTLDNYRVDKLVNAIFKEQYEVDVIDEEFYKSKIAELENELFSRKDIQNLKLSDLAKEYRELKNNLLEDFGKVESELRPIWDKYNNAKFQRANELRVLENSLVSMYKSVFSTPNSEVRNMITSVLSTDFSEESADAIDQKLSKQEKYFNIYSPFTQRNVMKLGADGKMGIGVHSNAVTMNSLLQQLDDPIQLYNYRNSNNEIVGFDIKLGRLIFNGKLGAIEDITGRRISEYLSESQNSSTDNQKLEIMGRRNENAETISVFSLMQMSALENDGLLVNVNGDKKNLSYSSLFISQPIMLKYVDVVKKYKSSTIDSFMSPEKIAFAELKEELYKRIDESVWEIDPDTKKPIPGMLKKDIADKVGETLTSRKLYDNITPMENLNSVDALEQFYILNTFETLKQPAEQVRKMQSFINIESGGMGVSYFDTIALKNFIKEIDDLKFISQKDFKDKNPKKSVTRLFFGDKITLNESEDNSNVDLSDYVFLYKENGISTYIKPSNHYSHKIMNSIGAGYNLWNSIFPYDNKVYDTQIADILSNANIKEGTKKAIELQYDIVSNMKDYSYTSSQTLFKGNFGAERNKIFFDDRANNQESLAGYLQRLKNTPGYSNMFRQPFFRDLQIEINDKTHPSIIKYVSGDMSKITNLRMYNLLERMTKSNLELPAKIDGTPMTEAELMKELLMYSLVADQGNGAIGFRHLLPMSLFSKYQIDTILRNRNNIADPIRTDLIYSGTNTSIENFLGSKINSQGVIKNNGKIPLPVNEVKKFYNILVKRAFTTTGRNNVYSFNESTGDIIFNDYKGEENSKDFVRQYFQHNPDKVGKSYRYSESTNSSFQKLLADNNAIEEDISTGNLTKFTIDTTKESNPDYVTIVGKDNKLYLYEKFSENVIDQGGKRFTYYRAIPKLGIFGYNEYQIGGNVNNSTVGINNVKPTDLSLPLNLVNVKDVINNNNIEELIQDMYIPNSPYSSLMNLLGEFVDNFENVDIKLVENMPGAASFNIVDGKPIIKFSKAFVENPKVNQRMLQDVIMEEVLHYVTRTTIDPYITFNGITSEGKLEYTLTDKKMPASLKTLLTVYNQALQHYVKKHGAQAIFDKWDKTEKIRTGKEQGSITLNSDFDQDVYRATNFHEFIAGIFIKDTQFAEEMANTKYLASNKTILQKFAEVLARFFNGLLPNTRRDTYSAEVANSLVYFLSDHKISVPKAEKTISEKKNNTVTEAKKALEDAQKDIKPPISNEASGYNSELNDDTNANNPKFTKMPLIEDYEYGYVYANKLPINLPGLDVYFSVLNNGTITAFDKRTAMSIVTINFEGEQSINDLFSVLETITPDEISDILNAPDFITSENIEDSEKQSEDKRENLNFAPTETNVKYKC